jgi:regulator of sirC expression with transglutaminase-like and TPR domain
MEALRELLTTGSPSVTLDVAALDLARIEHPGLDPAPWLRELDHLAFQIAERAGALDDAPRFLRIANGYLFDELGFHGNETDYYNPRNSCLNDVIASRTGLPIALSVVYIEVARRLAKPVFGIGAPGHFLVEFSDGRRRVFIDPFHRGRILTEEQSLAVSECPRLDNRAIVLRMLRNLEGGYLRLNDFERAVEVAGLLALGGESGASGRPPFAMN